MKFAMLIHEDKTPLQNTLNWLERNGHSHQLIQLHRGDPLPSLANFDAVIVHGGEANVDQEEKFPWLREEKKFIREVIQQRKKILGLCLGSQLIADVLGARVSRHPYWEVGWFPVTVPLSPESLLVFQWHGYSFDLPPGATRIARGTHWENQGYKIGEQIAAFQFHPESTETWVRELATEAKPEGSLVQSEAEILGQLPSLPKMTAWYFLFLDSFFGSAT